MTAIPTDPDQLEDWRSDPARYLAIEHLWDAYEGLVDALHTRLNETALLLRGTRPGPEQFEAARGRLVAAKAQWTKALADADALLYRRRQEGGDA